MARERISLVSDAMEREAIIRAQITSGEMTPETFKTLDPEEKKLVDEILFKMASEKIEPNQGISAIEFILFGFMRISNKKMNGMSLTAEDLEVEKMVHAICDLHEITNGQKPKEEWLFDYMGYAYQKSAQFLQNRREHIERKTKTTGSI